MKLKRDVVMLPTNNKATAPIFKSNNHLYIGYGEKLEYNNKDNSYQHLYITSDEEIKDGGWCIQNGNYLCKITCNQDRTQQGLKKIIATTDESLGLPSPSDGFIKKFIERYNAGNLISEVMVEYEEWPVLERITGTEASFRTVVKKLLKVDKNNCITIKAVKDSWTREEVIALCRDCFENSCKYSTFNEWIEQNL